MKFASVSWKEIIVTFNVIVCQGQGQVNIFTFGSSENVVARSEMKHETTLEYCVGSARQPVQSSRLNSADVLQQDLCRANIAENEDHAGHSSVVRRWPNNGDSPARGTR